MMKNIELFMTLFNKVEVHKKIISRSLAEILKKSKEKIKKEYM